MQEKICIVGLGYVGLPLAAAMAARFSVVGYDCDSERTAELCDAHDRTGELLPEELCALLADGKLQFSDNIQDAADCSVYIITVPTPLLPDKRPDLSPLRSACRAVGGVLKKGDLAVIESTVYPGVTEDVCAPLLAEASGLVYNQDFFCGYSPERINPSDRARPITQIPKVTAGSTPQAAARTDSLYREVIVAGTHPAPTIRVAEAAKVMENTQRDVNIALMNEFAMLCDSLNIDSAAAFAAAASKWNFLPFSPGLVGGHCIGVDPYYLCHKAQASGYQPNLILAARQINDSMGHYIADRAVYLMAQKGVVIRGAKALILGFSFKENCPDPRNSRADDIRQALQLAGCQVRVCDPVADKQKTMREYGFAPEDNLAAVLAEQYDVIIFAVAHACFTDIATAALGDALVIDVKGFAPRADWRL